jgi:recombination protein RecA
MAKRASTGATAGAARGGAGATGPDAKNKAMELAISTIEKQFGKGAITRMTDDGIDSEMPKIPTGSPSLDIALGIGGYH